MNSPTIDMRKVEAALERYGRKHRGKTHVEYPLQPSPVAQDSALRKPLRAHGTKCSGFYHPAFEHR